MDCIISTKFRRANIQALSIIRDITKLSVPDDEPLYFDFRSYNENTPFSNLVIANTVRQYVQSHNNKAILKPHASTYLSHLGFYDLIGAKYGKRIGEARANSNYVPLRRISLDGDFYSNIERNGHELSCLLQFDMQLQSFLEYIFIETIRNVFEHAETKEVFLSAQKWPSRNLLEISIADTGCGVSNSLGRLYKEKNELELLYLAGEPGITARSNYSYLDSNNAWLNSGYGLYILRMLSIAYGGSFMLCSGNYALHQTQKGITVYKTTYKGTAIAIRLKTDNNIIFEETRDRIKEEGERRAATIEGAIKKASKSSGGHYH